MDSSPHSITGNKVNTTLYAYVEAQGLATFTIEMYLAGLKSFHLLVDSTCATQSFHTPYINLIYLSEVSRELLQGRDQSGFSYPLLQL